MTIPTYARQVKVADSILELPRRFRNGLAPSRLIPQTPTAEYEPAQTSFTVNRGHRHMWSSGVRICSEVMCVCILLLVAAGATLAGSPKEPMDLVSYDFGFPLPGSTLTHSFVVTNHSDKQLQLLNVETSCGCTAAKLDKKLLEPGDVAVLKLIARVPVYAEDWVVQTIVKANEGGAAKELRFNLTAKVANLIEFSDAAPCFDLGDHKLDDLPLGKIITIRRGANPIEWEEIRCKSDNPNLKATVVRDGTQGWSLALEWSGIDCLGAMIGSLEFSFWKGSKELDYHVTRRALIRVVGPVCVSPISLLIGVVERGQSVRTMVRLSESPDQSMPFEIVDVKMNDKQHIRTGIRKEASEQIVTVEYLAGETPREDSGELLITVKADKTYKIRIPYLAMVIDGPSASGVAH